MARLVCLALACFFLVHGIAAIAVWLFTPRTLRFATRIAPRQAANFLLLLRLLPAAFAFFLVLFVCTPSYLWLETAGRDEEAGALCLFAAALGFIGLCVGLIRATAALWRCRRRFPHSTQTDQRFHVVDDQHAMLALVGLLRPRIFISQTIALALPPDELVAALSHEEAHRSSHDNLKRLLFLLTPGVLPFVDLFAPIEHAWAQYSEWAADDESVNGDPQRALSLASALLQFAKIGIPAPAQMPLSQFLADQHAFAARLERLITDRPTPALSAPRFSLPLTTVALFLLWVEPLLLQPVHQALELLMR